MKVHEVLAGFVFRGHHYSNGVVAFLIAGFVLAVALWPPERGNRR